MLQKLNKNKCFSFLFFASLIFIVFAGIYIRTKYYLSNVPMWLDEIMLVSSIVNRTISESFLPLDAFQKAPPLFILETIIIKNLFGLNELSLRFIPFILNILSLILFIPFLCKNIKNKIGIIIGLLIFAFNIPLIHYSTEFKPYGYDAFFTILILLISNYIDFSKLNDKQTVICTLLSMFFVAQSFPTAFIIPAVILSQSIVNKRFDYKVLWIGLGMLTVCFYMFLSDINNYIFLKYYWRYVEDSFYVKPSLVFLHKFIILNCSYYINDFDLNHTYLILGGFLGGYILLFKDNKKLALTILFVFMFAIIASALQFYPLKTRLMLYFLPIFVLLIAKFFDIINFINNKIILIFSNIILCLLIAVIFELSSIYNNYRENNYMIHNIFLNTRNQSVDDRNMVKNYSLKILNNYKPSETIIASQEFLYAIKYYSARYNLNNTPKIILYIDRPLIRPKEKYMEKIVINVLKHQTGVWFIGRNGEGYFGCLDLENIEDLLKEYHYKYDKYTLKRLYLVHAYKD